MASSVSVPIAAMNIDRSSVLGKNDIRFAWNIFAIETEAVAETVQ